MPLHDKFSSGIIFKFKTASAVDDFLLKLMSLLSNTLGSLVQALLISYV